MSRTDVGVKARQALVAGLLAALAIALIGAFAVVNLVGGDDGDRGSAAHRHGGGGAGSPVAAGARERPIGAVHVARAGGRQARLRVFAEVPGDTDLPAAAVPAGTPLRLLFDAADAGPGAERAELRGFTLSSDGAPPAPVTLDRRAAFLLNTRTGDLVLPAALAGHAHGGADPGQGLAALSPGGGFAWAAKLPGGAGSAVGHDGERFLAVPYRSAGRVELVDLLRRGRAGAVELRGRVGALAFAPGGRRLWAVEEAGGRLVGIEPRTREVVTRVAVGTGRSTLAVDAHRGQLLVTAGAGATLVDLETGEELGGRPLPAPAVAAAAAPDAGGYAVAHGDGRVTLLRARGDSLGALRTVRVGDPAAGTRTLGVAPDGRTAVVLNERAGELVLVDAASGSVMRRVPARAPRDLRFASHFALARSAGGADLTWVDLDEPSRSNVITAAPGRGLAPGLDEAEALVPSPAARKAYRVHVMHGRPMVMDEIANTIAADVAVVSSGALQPTGAGRLEQRTVLERPGSYRLELRMPDGPAFRFELRAVAPADGARARPRRERLRARVDEPLTVRFDVLGASPRSAQVLAYGGRPGDLRQLQAPARRVGARGYEATLRFPAPGRFRLELLSEEAGLRPGPGTGVVVRVR